MLPKYNIEYMVKLGKHEHPHHLQTDDPVTCEEFLIELLDRGFQIKAVKHEGVDLGQSEFDRMIKTAGGMLAAKRICQSLNIKPEEEHYRFGFAV